jgi:transcription-repair coupling factor (superfamily II helicase)
MFEEVLKNRLLRDAAGRIAPGRTLTLSGVWASSAPLAAAGLARLKRAPLLFVTAHLDEADEVADDIEVFTGAPAQVFPAWESDIQTGEHVTDDVAGERVRLCNLLLKAKENKGGTPKSSWGCPDTADFAGHPQADLGVPQEPVDFVVAPVMSLLQPVPTPEALAVSRLPLAKGQEIELETLVQWLVDAGFERVDQIDQQGEFAHRGGIVDIFPAGTTQAARVEFFGATIDSIRRFDLDTQRSIDELDAYDVTAVAAAAQPYSKLSHSLLDYLPPGTIVCLREPQEVMAVASEIYRRLTSGRAEFLKEADAEEDATTPAEDKAEISARTFLHNPEDLFPKFSRFALVEMRPFAGAEAPSQLDLGVRSIQKLSLNTADALTELAELSEVADVHVYCENQAEIDRFGQTLGASHPALAAKAKKHIGHVHGGFYWPSQRLVIVGHHEIFHRYAKVRRIRRVRTGRPIESLLDLSDGDYVVHVMHGIAKFEGLKTLERDGRSEEYLALRFSDNAVLHVPSTSINLVQKYIGARGKRPPLSKLGGTAWAKQKARAAVAVTDMAAQLLRIQAMRQASQGVSYAAASDWQRQFEEEFIYTETEDQIVTMRQIDDDMAHPRPMDRLLCGDVGYGKTELAMRAAFKVAEAGKQVAVLVPTTVLAAQHWRTFGERFADYPFSIEQLSRFRTPKEQKDALTRLAAGQVDVVIGTHRLLSKDVHFADLGLVVIDEEQRFGVEHKERLKNLRASVEVLTMTATPIPRTLHMALLGLRDISSLSTPPMDRRAIHTEVREYDDELVRQVIYRELNRQGQVFFVHNRVMDIQSVADRVKRLAPEARVAVGHGQMAHAELEEVMLRLVNQQIDVLVCTTIIESGLDIATANTMVIHEADRFGLAELHQLRGRVGRYKHRAYCYLLLPERRTLTSVAAKRLKAIEEFSDLGAGFAIAMRDLEIRGAGNILGEEQSGHIAAVGYELYCQLLEEAVRQAKGEPAPVRRDAHVDLGVDSFIPKEYVPSDRQRMEIYRRLARCATAAELQQLSTDLADAFGPVPPEAQTLLDLAETRVRAGDFGIQSIIRMDPDLIFTFRDFTPAKHLFDGARGSVRLPDERTVHWRLPKAYMEMPTLLRVLLNRLRQAKVAV